MAPYRPYDKQLTVNAMGMRGYVKPINTERPRRLCCMKDHDRQCYVKGRNRLCYAKGCDGQCYVKSCDGPCYAEGRDGPCYAEGHNMAIVRMKQRKAM